MLWIKSNWFVIVAALFLIGALGDWPYFYYQLLRWVVFGVAAYIAFKNYKSGSTIWVWIFGIVAVLFNPIVPFYFPRETWKVLDFAATVLFLLFPLISAKHHPQESKIRDKIWRFLNVIIWMSLLLLSVMVFYESYYLPHGPQYDAGYDRCDVSDSGPCGEMYVEDTRKLNIPEWVKFLRVENNSILLFFGLALFGIITASRPEGGYKFEQE